MDRNPGHVGTHFNFEERFIPDHEKLVAQVDLLKNQGKKIVLTSGSFDLIHVGHARYLWLAKLLGDVLIVGVETDRKVRSRKKGDMRPVVPQQERYEMLAHIRYVDFVTVKDKDDPPWNLIKQIRPDVLQAVVGTYTQEEVAELKQYCGEVVIQPRQAETSTSAKIRLVVIAGMHQLSARLIQALPEFVTKFYSKNIEKMNEAFHQELIGELSRVTEEIKKKGEL